ncbi:MAG: hypothetical protein N3B18_06830 [Desulfobacterota bacterium]|nr:hypothetical protein [Thermodesulfobacteriota bacterium]
MKKFLCIMAIMGILIVCFSWQIVQAAYIDKTTANGQIRIVYPGSPASICDAILIGVGTSMSRADYDNVANALISYGYIVVIMDHNPGDMVKTDATKYKNCALDVKANLISWLSGTGCTGIAHWIMGGHSAGGQAAQNAISNNPGLADAVFSLDPYNCSGAGSISVPALYWGFNVTTCFVTKEDAARAAYYGSLGHRAFYRVKKVYIVTPCGYAPKFFHCSFCDLHCPGCTNCLYTPDYFFTDLAKTVNKFITAAFYGTWSKANLTVTTTTPTELFVDSDMP